jgi:hypothetical protein
MWGIWTYRRRGKHFLALMLAFATLAVGAGCGGGEEPVARPVTDVARAETLAGRYEPDLMLERHDGFWPVSVRTIDRLGSGGKGACLAPARGASCAPIQIAGLEWDESPRAAYIDYPAGDTDIDAQHDAFAATLSKGAPGTAARMYYYVTGRDPDRPVSLQYWFYYPYNYLPVHLSGPFSGATLTNVDLHEGDFEGMGILLSAHKHLPVYVWMPRHTEEGERFVWNEGMLKRHETHPVGFVARGSHATYESCGHKFRTNSASGDLVDLVPDDNISCRPGDLYELGDGIGAVNLARTWWACWPGHFGSAPGYGAGGGPLNQVRSQLDADGPLSPLFQQKFDLNKPQPCDNASAPSEVPRDHEVLADPETAAVLGQGGGRLNDLFRSCDEWSQRPAEGSYMVACDQATLDAFFESGLEDRGSQDLRIRGVPEPTGRMVPAVFASGEPSAVDEATIETSGVAHPEVYVAIRNGGKLTTAEFSSFELQPGQRLRLRRESGSPWLLVDARSGEEIAEANSVESEFATAPAPPRILSATRDGDEIDLRFSAGTSPATRLIVFAGATSELPEAGRIVAALRGNASGSYQANIADPDRHLNFLRVIASHDSLPAASQVAKVVEAP